MDSHRTLGSQTAPRTAPLIGRSHLLALLVLVLGSSPVTVPAPAPEPEAASPRPRSMADRLLEAGPIRGIALGLFSQDPRYDYAELLSEIRDTGAPWVSIVVNYYQQRNDSTETGIPDPRSAPDRRVITTLRQARALGLRVLLFPILLIQQPGEDDWRGTLAPANREAWFHSYGQLILRLARIAAAEGVEILSLGSEFNSLQEDTDAWLTLIRRVRKVYPGAVTYSVNWDAVERPGFFSALDLVGMTTYFSLTDKKDPTVDELVEAWQPIREDILLWQATLDLPLMFTEVGFASQDGINQNPWNYFLSGQVDLQEQRDCYEAFTRVWRDEPALQGTFFYNWFGPGGAQDTGYTPRGKPAVEVIRGWFPRPGRAPASSPPRGAG